MVARFTCLILVVCASLIVGCSKSPKQVKSDGKPLSGADEQIFIGDTIEKNYDPNVIMKRAESFFDKEDYPEAIIEYQHFLDLHRVHTLAFYAQYKLAESHFKQIKTIDRDPDPVYKALEAFEKLRRDYPGSRHDADAVERIGDCHKFIAQAYMLVGQFYYRREAYLAAAHRFESILTQYPEMEIAGDALYYLAITYNKLGADDWAREKLIALGERFPTNQNIALGRKLLAKLNAKQPADAVALSSSRPNGNATDQYTMSSGSLPPPAGISPLAPVTSLAPSTSLGNSIKGSSSPEMTLCRLGVWC
ncbi:MAG TPA: outer membrane protein assembly factor BamD [Nitrospiraceae bacterium]|nr:outer membrane protein assembly factor BamD [Nitrospiraceae bacterium]